MNKIYEKVASKLFFSGVIVFLIESYMQLCLSTVINLYYVSPLTLMQK